MIDNAVAIRQAVGHRIKVRRVEKSLLQKELADLVGVEQTQVSTWESGKRALRIEEAIRIAKVLETTVGYLVGERPRAD